MGKNKKLLTINLVHKKLTNDDTGYLLPEKGGKVFTLCLDTSRSFEILTKTFFHEMTHVFMQLLTKSIIEGKKIPGAEYLIERDIENEENLCRNLEQLIWQELKNLKRSK